MSARVRRPHNPLLAALSHPFSTGAGVVRGATLSAGTLWSGDCGAMGTRLLALGKPPPVLRSTIDLGRGFLSCWEKQGIEVL